MKAKYIYETLGFTEDSDPIADMEIGHNAQMKKLDKQFAPWDWNVEDYDTDYDEEIIDIIEYRGFHIKITHAMPKFFDSKTAGDFYLGIEDIGEPYTNGPHKWKNAKEALKHSKSWLDAYLDD